MTLIVGITGGIGSGKSAVTSLLDEYGITVVDADVVARIIVEPGTSALKQIAQHYGTEILQSDGSLDRAALRTRVFSSATERKWLEALTHPLIGEEILKQLQSSDSAYTVLSSPLLLETQQKVMADVIVVVDVSEEVQIARTVRRDSNTRPQVKKILAAQISRDERLALANIVIDNSGSPEQLRFKVADLHAKLLAKAAERSN